MKLSGVGFILSSVLIAGGTQNLSGKWDVEVEGYGAPRSQKIRAEAERRGSVGRLRGQIWRIEGHRHGKDAAVEFEMRVIENERIVTVHYVGTASDDGIKGTVTFGDVGKGTWVASRATASHKK